MKEWLTLIIVLLIIILIIDGWRRTRNSRYGSIKMSPGMKKRMKQEEERQASEGPTYTSELPNGGARVVGRRESDVAQSQPEKKHTRPTSERRSLREPEQTRLNLGESVPILMEEIQEPAPVVHQKPNQSRQQQHERLEPNDRIEPTFSAPEDDYAEDDYDSDEYARDDDEYEGEDYEDDDHPYDRELDDDRDYGRDVEDHSRDDEFDHDEDADEYDEVDEDDDQGQASAANAQLQANPEEVLIINVMAHKGSMFNGSLLLDTLLQCGMRYGDMDIFHRYSDAKGEGTLLFSMANMVKPGTFDLDAMDEFETPGVSLFMTLPLKADSMQSFDLMLDTAKSLAEALNGELKDEQRSVMTRQTIEHCRQRILDFERRRLFQRPR